MKVVLFCGGLGMRLREYSETIPKPMVPIGYRPIIWHLMKYYAHWGHREFILCLGYRGDVIKRYFLDYDECLSNDFVLSGGGRDVRLMRRDIDDWTITFVDTGLATTIGERLRAVRDHLGDDDVFLANYTDGLADLPLPEHLEAFERQRKIASFVAVRPYHSFHVVSVGESGLVTRIRHASRGGFWINGGFFVFRQRIFDYLREGEDLIEAPFQRLIAKGQLMAYRHRGFWACMDTFKDKQTLEDMSAEGRTPWVVWNTTPERAGAPTLNGGLARLA